MTQGGSRSSCLASIQPPGDFAVLKQSGRDPSFRWQVLLGVCVVILVASLIGNAALAAVLSNYAAMKRDRDYSYQVAADAKVAMSGFHQREQTLNDRLAAVESQLGEANGSLERAAREQNRLRAAESRAQQQVADLLRDPADLPGATREALLAATRTVKVRCQMDEEAQAAGLSYGMVIDEMREAVRNGGIVQLDENAQSTLFVSIDQATELGNESVWIVRAHLVGRWRIPGTSTSWQVSVAEEVSLCTTRGSNDRASAILRTVAAVTKRLNTP